MTLSGFLISQQFGDFNKVYLAEVKSILNSYDGGEQIGGAISFIDTILNKSEEEFIALAAALRAGSDASLNLKTHTTILLDSNAVQISRLPMNIQIKVYEFKNSLNIFNQEVLSAKEKWKLTFDSSISAINHERISSDLSSSYANLQNVCSKVCDKIQVILDSKLQ